MPFVPNEENVDDISFTIKGRVEGIRLDRYLVKRYPDYSRAYFQKLVKKGNVLIEGKITKISVKIRAGQKVSISLPKLEPLHLKPEEIPLDIIYEDGDVAIINKQVGYVVHPSRGHMGGTIVNGLIHHFQNLSDCNDEYRPGIVHRLDRNTSGALLIAKNNRAHHKLGRQFEKREINKQYIALVEGEITVERGNIDLPVGIDPRNRKRMAVLHGGKNAITDYQVVARYPGFTLVHVFPKTGRTHQIRIHFKSQGHPLVGDDLYGANPIFTENRVGKANRDVPLIKRQALHAWQIAFEHPSTLKMKSVIAPLAKDFFNTLKFLQFFWPTTKVAEFLGN